VPKHVGVFKTYVKFVNLVYIVDCKLYDAPGQAHNVITLEYLKNKNKPVI
jgi:hypothetical protein